VTDKPNPPDGELARLRARVAELERERAARLDAEAALRESEERYRELVDQCPDPILVHRDGILLFVNAATLKMAGTDVKPRDLVGRNVLDFVHADQKQFAEEAIQAVAAGEPPLGQLELRVYDADGNERFVQSLDREIVFEGEPAVQVVVRDITARRRAEDALREMRAQLERRVAERTAELSQALGDLRHTEARLRAMLRGSPDTLIRMRTDGTLLDVHPGSGFAEFFGRQSRVGRNLGEFADADLTARSLEKIRQVSESGRMDTFDYVIERAGESYVFESRIVPIGPDEVLAVLRDITEARRAQEELADRELRFRKIFEEGPLGMALVAPDLTFFNANARLCEMLGYDAEELAKLSFLELTHPDDRARDLEILRDLADGKRSSFTLDKRFVRKDGGVIDVRVTGAMIRDADGQIAYGIGMYEDITEERRSAAALRDSEEQLRMIFEESPMGMALIGTDLHVRQANPALCRILGYDEEELERRSFLVVTHPDDRDRDIALMRKLDAGELRSFSIEKRFVHRDGHIVPCRVTGALLRDEAGEPLYGMAMFEDITEEKRAAAALRDTEERLHHSARLASIGTLAAGIAHEINNPIGSILIAAQYARSAKDDPAEVMRSLEDISDHARRCGRIVKNVLRFARQETLERRREDLNECLERVRGLVGHLAERHEAAVDYRFASRALPVEVSSTAVEQALFNVIRNAIEASKAGDRVEVRTEADTTHARVVVTDHGRGMTAEENTYLFDPFYTTRRAEGGTGLGLSISHGIITDHGGVIHVESQPGRGTQVSIALPLADGPVDPRSHDGESPDRR
jgi:PAS domain S-box-containing protein